MAIIMQAIPLIARPGLYNDDMLPGRPSQHPRTPFGERVFEARTAAGLSQAQVAEQLGITQSGFADWERHSVALKPEQLLKLSEILGKPVEELIGVERPRRGRGPAGRAKRVFEKLSDLPRSQQGRILDSLELMLAGHASQGSG